MQRIVISIICIVALSALRPNLSHSDDRFGGTSQRNSSNRTWPSQFITPVPAITVHVPPRHTNPGWRSGTRIFIDDRFCRSGSNYIAPPHVDITSTKRLGGPSTKRVKVVGTIEGICLVEGGVFEDGEKVQSINIRTSPDFARFQFTAIVRADRSPEIRVYNANGDRDARDPLELLPHRPMP